MSNLKKHLKITNGVNAGCNIESGFFVYTYKNSSFILTKLLFTYLATGVSKSNSSIKELWLRNVMALTPVVSFLQ